MQVVMAGQPNLNSCKKVFGVFAYLVSVDLGGVMVRSGGANMAVIGRKVYYK